VPESAGLQDARPIRAETRVKLIASIAHGRRWLDEIVAGTVTDVEQIAAREKCSVRKVNMTISLAFLAPDLIKAAIEGRLPRGIGVARLCDCPSSGRVSTGSSAFPILSLQSPACEPVSVGYEPRTSNQAVMSEPVMRQAREVLRSVRGVPTREIARRIRMAASLKSRIATKRRTSVGDSEEATVASAPATARRTIRSGSSRSRTAAPRRNSRILDGVTAGRKKRISSILT